MKLVIVDSSFRRGVIISSENDRRNPPVAPPPDGIKTPGTDYYSDLRRSIRFIRRYAKSYHVDPPMLIVHGEADKLVPLTQASKMVDKLMDAGVKAKLVVAKGKAHGWHDTWRNEMKHIADWFDTHLAAEKQ